MRDHDLSSLQWHKRRKNREMVSLMMLYLCIDTGQINETLLSYFIVYIYLVGCSIFYFTLYGKV